MLLAWLEGSNAEIFVRLLELEATGELGGSWDEVHCIYHHIAVATAQPPITYDSIIIVLF